MKIVLLHVDPHAIAAFAAAIIILLDVVVDNASPNKGSKSIGAPNDLEVVTRAVFSMESGANAIADGNKINSNGNNSTSLHRETIVIVESVILLPIIVPSLIRCAN